MFESQRISFVPGLALGLLIGVAVTFGVVHADAPGALRGVTRLATALSLVDTHYVDPVDGTVLLEGAVDGMVGSLDRYSEYMDAREYADFGRATSGRFVGIGVEIESRDGWLVVVSVFPGGPAEQAGVLPGDRILAIGDTLARDLRVPDAIELVRGESGSTLRLALRRVGVDQAVEVELVRAPVQFPAVESVLLPGDVLYVRIRAFQDGVARAFSDELDRGALTSRARGGLRGVVVDLRANGGGLLTEAVDIADEFLAEGVIVSTRARVAEWTEAFPAHRRGTRPDWPIAVLIDGNSASASEILAAALRDTGRARIVGVRSFGKGTVQEVVPLPEGGALKLTIARFYSPTGQRIDGAGVTPHVVLEPSRGLPGGDLRPETLAADAYVAAALAELR